ncbi:hypothetical protein BKI52_02210 [marine bacterium AO1-C]|nr:hypothetical protein BKI52_02210 [marine bacterium AO1-C]
MSIYQRQERSKEEVLSFFSQPTNRTIVAQDYEKVAPIEVADAIKLQNTEQRMVALRSFEPETIVEALDATLLNSQTVEKTQVRWDEQLKPYKHTYKDTYELYKILGSSLGVVNSWTTVPNIYIVKCECPSTQRLYYLYVPEEVAVNKDAIEAVAWTMRFNDQPLTKQQYLNLMYTET